MKYYYDNLADALQAMKHGIKLYVYPCDDLENEPFEIEALQIGHECDVATIDDLSSIENRFFVDEKSEYLLQPQEKDEYKDGWFFKSGEWQHSEYPSSWSDDEVKTAFRNNIYFPQPKELKYDSLAHL
jgi:hypothetical protein